LKKFTTIVRPSNPLPAVRGEFKVNLEWMREARERDAAFVGPRRPEQPAVRFRDAKGRG
jgi:hypothetical protein